MFVLLIIVTPVIYAEDSPKDVNITKDNGNGGGRSSIETNNMLSVSFDQLNLYITCVSINADLNIVLYIGRLCVLEEYIPSDVSSSTIPIFQLEKGQVYQLEIISQQGERWTGAFLYE